MFVIFTLKTLIILYFFGIIYSKNTLKENSMANYIQNDIGVCPYCKRRIHASYNKVLNLSYRKDLQNSINLKNLNTSTCVFCDEVFRFETEIFVFDFKNKYAIIVNKEGADTNYSHLRKDIYNLSFGNNYHLRYVTTCLEMVEKIHLFNHGLDDKAVEIAKQLYFAHIMDNLKEHHRFLVSEISEEMLTFTLYDDHDKSVHTETTTKSVLDDIHINTQNTNSPFSVYEKIGNKWAKEYLNGGKIYE